MTKPIKSLFAPIYKLYSDKVYYIKEIGGNYKILGWDFIGSDEKIIEFKDYTVKIPESRVLNKYGQFVYYIDVEKDKGATLKAESEKVESLGGGINDSILSSNLMEKLNKLLGEGQKPETFWLALGVLLGALSGFGVMRILMVVGVI